MRARAGLLILLLVGAAALASGCLGATTSSEVVFNGRRAGGGLLVEGGGSGAMLRPFDGPDSVAVEVDGSPGRAVVALVRETMYPRGTDPSWRHPCGGALLGVPDGADDPRIDLLRLEHVRSHRVVDAEGAAWTVDRYARPGAAHDDANASVWVVNLGGGQAFAEDDGRAHCPVEGDASEAYNALLVAPGLDALKIWFSPRQRPAPPAQAPMPDGPGSS